MRSSPKVLIVEEHTLHAKGFSAILEKKGFQTCIASEREEIYQIIETHHVAEEMFGMHPFGMYFLFYRLDYLC